MIRNTSKIILLAIYLLSSYLYAKNPLTITTVPPAPHWLIQDIHYWSIYLDGEISPNSANKLAKVMKDKKIKYGKFYFNSPGGSLYGGLRIGRLIREHKMETAVGQYDSNTKKTLPGYCYSACALAFLGGGYRYLDNESVMGVHQFSKNKYNLNDLQMAQYISGDLVHYLESMGASIKLFKLMSQINNNKIYQLSQEQVLELGIVNQGHNPSYWSIEPVKGHLYLKGVQFRFSGGGKVLFTCHDKIIVFHPIYDAGKKAEHILSHSIRSSILLNSKEIPLSEPITPPFILNGGVINSRYYFDSSIAKGLHKQTTIGYAMHAPNKALYWGFSIDIKGGEDIIEGYMNNCFN